MTIHGMSGALLRGAAVAVGLASICGSLPANAQDVRIGALEPLTGALSQYGGASVKGIQLALEQVNAQGGVLGDRSLDLITGDTQSNPQAGVSAAQQLARLQNVACIIGALSSGVTIAAATSVAVVDGVPMISPASTAQAITNIDDNDFLFRTAPHDGAQGAILAAVAREAGYERLAILYVNNAYGIGLAEVFTARFEALGGSVTASVPYEPGQASYRGELQAAAQGGAEALVHMAYPGDGIPQLRQALEEGFFDKFVFTDGMKTPEMITNVGAEFLNGAIGTTPEAVESNASAIFRAAYTERYGAEDLLPFTDTAYDAAFIFALAIEKAGTTDRTAIRDALRAVAGGGGMEILPGEWAKAKAAIAAGEEIDYQGAAGTQDFDAAGDVPGTIGIWVIKDGEFVTREIRAG